MLKVPDSKCKDFGMLFQNHRMHMAATNIYYNHIKLIVNQSRYIDRDTYMSIFEQMFMDIEFKTSPIDAFVPVEKVNPSDRIFVTNQIVPEYVEIQKRITADVIKEKLDVTHPACIAITDDVTKLADVIDDIYMHFCTFRYLAQIDVIRLSCYSNYTEIIEYVVNNISKKDLESFMSQKRLNPEKYDKYCEDIMFNPDVKRTQMFYLEDHGDIKAFDVTNLMLCLTTNIVFKSDIYIILGIYLILSFAIPDVINEKIDDSPCVAYVRDVLSKI